MGPLLLNAEQWHRLAGPLVDLTAAAGLALTAAFAFLLGRVIVPAFADAPANVDRADEQRQHGGTRAMHRLLGQLAIVSAIASLVGLGRAIVGAVDVLQNVYPRFMI
jgi:hypothetical protein